MAKEEKKPTKPKSTESVSFIRSAPIAALLDLIRQTALAQLPEVKNYDNKEAPLFYQKEQDLRRLVYRQHKNHADLRNNVTRLLALKQVKAE